MLTPKQQWCMRCKRYVQTEQKHSPVGKQKTLVRTIISCLKCRTTLSSKTTSAAAVEQLNHNQPQ